MLLDTVNAPFDSKKMTTEEIEFIKKNITDIIMKASCSYPFNLTDMN